MTCNCSLTEKITGILVIVFAWWQTGYNDWILTVLGLSLIYHAWKCANCNMQGNIVSKPAVKKSGKKKK